MSRKGWFLLGLLLALAGVCRGQRISNWRVYRIADGLPESACASVTVSPRGRVCVRHLNVESVTGLDGYTVRSFPAPGPIPGRIYESAGGQLWAAANQGLEEFQDGSWVRYPVREIAAEYRASAAQPQRPCPLCPVRQGRVLFMLPDGLFEFSIEHKTSAQTRLLLAARQTTVDKFNGMIASHDGGLWIAATHGLVRLLEQLRSLKPESDWHEFVVPPSLQVRNLQEPREDSEGGVTVVADNATDQTKVILHFDGQHWDAYPTGSGKIRFAWRGPDKRIWAATSDSLLVNNGDRPEFEECQEIFARQFFDVATEPSGSFWLATSDGLFRASPCLWQVPGSFSKNPMLADCATVDSAGRLWFASLTALHSVENDQITGHAYPASMGTLQGIRAIYSLSGNVIVLDTANGLFQFRSAENKFSTLPNANRGGGQRKVLGSLKGGSLCIQTLDAAGGPSRLESYDGVGFGPLPFPALPPDFTGELTAAFTAQDGDFWLCGRGVVGWYHNEKWQTFMATDGSAPLGASSFFDLPDGKICCATADKLWEFNGRNWTTVRVGFDRINSALRAHDGSIWVASNSGLLRFQQNAWIGNALEDGLPTLSIRQILEDSGGRIWACTTRGLSIFHPEADPDWPETSVQILADRETNSIPEGTTVTVAFSGRDKWKYTLPDRLLYSYRLDDMDWSPFQEP
ncbi:MAG TPA: hypothetical protein VN281_13295, partial [Verrucomicrobiae bacterium]|nr:hypothetical protein [Verrucomicrobiae bacterium]